MKRFIDSDLLKWKNSRRRKPLLLRGARQIGKTYTIKQFAAEQFSSFVLIDFERNSNYTKIFETDLSPVRIIRDIEIVTGQKITDNTLLFFDEIQECPKAIMALRYFFEELHELYIIAAGSLLEFTLDSISFPVGRIQMLNMYPMTFPEYLYGLDYNEAAETILSKPEKLSSATHKFLLKQLHTYIITGGMPESVMAYKETNSIIESQEVLSEIISTYRLDFPKYLPKVDNACLNMVFSSVAQSVGKQIKYTRLAKDFSNPTIKKSFEILKLARLIYKVSSANPPEYPLATSASEKVFKALFLDIGIMQILSGMKIENEYLKSDILSIYQGALAEQFVGQELIAANDNQTYYWSRRAKNSQAEVDYLLLDNDVVIPVEVKSGAAGRLKSMHLFLDKYRKSPFGIVFSSREYKMLHEQKLIFVPLYYVFSVACQNFTR